jgi:hypothetical protein
MRWICTFLLWMFALPLLAVEVRVIDAKTYYLGTPGFPEWQEFAGKTPHGRRLDLRFEAKANAIEYTLLFRQRQVKFRWPVLLNNKRIGWLQAADTPLTLALAIPPQTLKRGKNTISIVAPKRTDDIEVGPFQLATAPMEQILKQGAVIIRISDENASLVPCRITITEPDGTLAAMRAMSMKQPLALRPGVVYTSNGKAELNLQPGKYTIYASRGFEYGIDKKSITISKKKILRVDMRIQREVPTPGLVSVDSHIHCLTYSGHGDASVEERMHTIAGEGIELAIATDHNHHADYQPIMKATGTSRFFTSVIGNEVTTKTGHFNAFPIVANSPVPDYKLGDWTKLMASIRSTQGVRVIVLNHPHNTHSGFRPLAPENFNPVTGRHLHGAPYSFDAMEVVTSAAMQSDNLRVYSDWFALLNHGYRVAGVGSSDTHDVSRFILGQARTYVECPDTNPAKVDVAKACDSFRNLRAYISMGLLVRIRLEDQFTVGDLASNLKEQMRVNLRVLGPSWVKADKVTLYANGKVLAQKSFESNERIEKINLTLNLPRPKYDVHLIAVATGPGIRAPFWESPRSYQPTSRKHVPLVQGATNPIWIDGDGDGKFTAARGYAQRLVKIHSRDLPKLFAALEPFDQAVAEQAAELLVAAGQDVRNARFREHLISATPATLAGFTAFIATLPPKTP